MKKSFTVFLLIYFSVVACLFAEDKFPFIGEVTSDNVNIRAGSNINFEVIAKSNLSEKLKVLNKEFQWYKISLPAEAGCFVSKKYITKESKSEGKVKANRLNVRARPDLKSSILCQVVRGDTVSIVKKADEDWYQIKPASDCYGWIHSKYISFYSTVKKYEKEQQKECALLEEKPAETPEVKKEKAPKDKCLKAEAPEKKFDFERIGIIRRHTSFFVHPGSHKLTQDGKTICYLKGDKAKLNSFVNLKVKILGNIQDETRFNYPVVVVEKIKIIE